MAPEPMIPIGSKAVPREELSHWGKSIGRRNTAASRVGGEKPSGSDFAQPDLTFGEPPDHDTRQITDAPNSLPTAHYSPATSPLSVEINPGVNPTRMQTDPQGP
jgi:hypothetical protein